MPVASEIQFGSNTQYCTLNNDILSVFSFYTTHKILHLPFLLPLGNHGNVMVMNKLSEEKEMDAKCTKSYQNTLDVMNPNITSKNIKRPRHNMLQKILFHVK